MEFDIIDLDGAYPILPPIEACDATVEQEPLLEEITPPYFIMKNVAFNEELAYYLSDTGLPVYYAKGDSFRLIGQMSPSLDNVFKSQFLNTGLSYVDEQGEEKELSLAEDFVRFITLPSDCVDNIFAGCLA